MFHDSFFKPVYNLSVWHAPNDDDNFHGSMKIRLLSGIDKKNEIDIRVVDVGDYLEYSIKNHR